jgi:predicted TIM-barrel fold metal-dependent hydrolase
LSSVSPLNSGRPQGGAPAGASAPEKAARAPEKATGFRLISGDAHLEVPCDMWAHRVAAAHRDRVPRRIRLANGGDAWVAENQPLRVCGLEMSARHPGQELKPFGNTYAESPGAGPPEQRLAELDLDGIDAEVLFTGIGGPTFWRGVADDDAYRAILRGYNDWLAEEYCSVAPARLLGMGVIPETTVDDAIAELTHCRDLGLRGVVLNAFPTGLGYPTDDDDRFWAAALDLGMPITVHVQFKLPVYRGPTFPYKHQAEAFGIGAFDIVARFANYAMRGGLNTVQLIMHGVFDRFPDLRIYFAENNIGWIPHWLEQWDQLYDKNMGWAHRYLEIQPLKRRPSDYVHEHVYWGFIRNPIGVQLRHLVGVDRILWSHDFPHNESDWPNSQKAIAEMFADVPDDERARMLCWNAAEFFGLA